jgi:hypothetical protein
MKISLFVLKFLFIGALFIISNEQLYLKNPVDRDKFFDLYYSWISSLFDQAARVTGYVVDSQWLPRSAILPPASEKISK